MFWLVEELLTLGDVLYDIVLWPLLLWSVVALAGIILLNKMESLSPDYQYYLRLSLLWVLPLGLTGSVFTEYLSTRLSSEVAVRYVFTGPLIDFTGLSAAQTPIYTKPMFWLGLTAAVLMLVSLMNLLKITAGYLRLLLWGRRLNFTPLYKQSRYFGNVNTRTHWTGYVTVAYSGNTTVPFTYGWLKPRIVLPESLKDQADKRAIALRHELRHIKQYDFPLNVVSALLRAFFWFHPLVNHIHQSIQEYSELLCDASLLTENISFSRKDYALLLYEFATQQPQSTLAVNMASTHSSLKKRIAMINTISKQSLHFRSSLLMSFLSAFLLILGISCTDIGQDGITSTEVENAQSQIRMENSKDGEPLFIINGEPISTPEQRQKFSRLKPEYIEKIEVLKGEKALEAYGDEGKYGVVEISLSNPEMAFNDLKDPSDIQSEDNNSNFFIKVNKPPELIGGIQSIQKNINYPEEARQAGVEGRVIIQFIIDEEGNVTKPKVVRGVGNGLDEAALEAVKTAQFTPGMQDGKPVKVRFTLPVTFQLPSRN